MEKLNIAELLKYCPKGIKLYSPIFGDVYLEKIRPHLAIVVTTDKEQGDFKEEFLYDGRYGINGECMLFPSKGKTTWEGFQRPFKNGDVIVYDNPNKITKDREEKDKAKAPNLKGEDYSCKRFGYKIPDGYEFDVVADGKIFLKPIKSKYPTTYAECCKILDIREEKNYTQGYKCGLICKFQELYIARNAYWKIAGEEMGLGKPWEPDWDKLSTNHEFIVIEKGCFTYSSSLLVFPTEEMRDAFYENFKDLIEQCKELL